MIGDQPSWSSLKIFMKFFIDTCEEEHCRFWLATWNIKTDANGCLQWYFSRILLKLWLFVLRCNGMIAPSTNFNTLSNIVVTTKKGTFYAIEIHTESTLLKAFNSSNSIKNLSVHPSTGEPDTYSCYTHTHVIT